MYNVKEITAVITANRPGCRISTHLLMYILYLAQKKHIKDLGTPLFDAEIIKPKEYTFPYIGEIMDMIDKKAGAEFETFREYLIPVAADIMCCVSPYIRLTSQDLTEIMKSDTLWKQTPKGSKIKFKKKGQLQ